MIQLEPGDVLLSWKQPEHTLWPPRNVLERFGHWRLRKYGEHLYPSGDVCYDHVRLVCGPIFEDTPHMILGFEFTFPAARFFWFPEDPEHWMYGSSYSKPFRPNESAMTGEFRKMSPVARARRLHQKCLVWNGTPYDLGQLFDIGLGLDKVFDFGRGYNVCSSGGRVVHEGGGVLIPNLFPEVKRHKTPPCSWINSSLFEAVA